MFADLHLHTNFSDGTYSPEELAAQGERHQMAAMSLTDHDTVEGCARMRTACASRGIEFISGTELTAEWQGIEVHILGYFLDTENQALLDKMTRFQNVRQDRVRQMVARLNEMGIPITAESVFALANCRSPGRPHVGRALVQQGFCSSMDEAFERFLKVNRPAWAPKFKMSFTEAVDLIHQAGGLAVMAHPGLNRSDQVIPELVTAGIDGLECFHTKHSLSTSGRYVKMAEQYGLLVTGGSDCHGMSKGRPLIGTVRLDYGHVVRLKAAAEGRQSRPAPNPPPPAPSA
jgi:predicted metal-dependent phosphoesterase TrpH